MRISFKVMCFSGDCALMMIPVNVRGIGESYAFDGNVNISVNGRSSTFTGAFCNVKQWSLGFSGAGIWMS